MTTIIGFTVGGQYEPGNGFTVVGAHTDSPCLRVKPRLCSVKQGSLVLNTQPYGGGLWHTWFDRDLGLAGRVVLRGHGTDSSDNSGLCTRLVLLNRAVARIPTLCIHMADSRDNFAPNLHEHAKAILSMNSSDCVDSDDSSNYNNDGCNSDGRLHPYLTKIIADEIGEKVENIIDLELQLIDLQPTAIGGINSDMIFSGRLDNLCSSYQCARALIDSATDNNDPLSQQTNIRLAFLFDHEEVGSNSTTGAGSSLFMNTLTLITNSLLYYNLSLQSKDLNSILFRSLRKSFVVSIDMAHALHPNCKLIN